MYLWIIRWFASGVIMVGLFACGKSTSTPPAIIPSLDNAIGQVMMLCSSGIDDTRRGYLEAELKLRGGSIDAGYQRLTRNAILAMVNELEFPEEDRLQAAVELQRQYLDCVEEQLDDVVSGMRREKERIALAKCLAGCCENFNCRRDCPMTSYKGIEYPSGDGSSCQEYQTSRWGCRTNAVGYMYCTFWPTYVTYDDLQLCMEECSYQ